MQTDNFGRLVAPAFGFVPLNVCPFQSCRNGEDFAILMTTQCFMEPFKLHIDCEGTLQALADPSLCKTLGGIP